MKPVYVVGLVVLAALVGAGGVFMATRPAGSEPYAGPRVRDVTLPEGTEVPLLLAETLEAGQAKEGDEVTLLVSEDVVVDGAVVVMKGQKVTGHVVQSRGASLVSALSNRPARLAISIDGGEAILTDVEKSGATVKYQLELAAKEADDEGSYQFTQENTAGRADAAKVDALWEDPKAREAMTALAEKMVGGTENAPAGSEDSLDTDVRTIAEKMGLKKTEELADKGVADPKGLTLGKAVDSLVAGNMGSYAGGDAVLALQAMGEVADVVSSVDHKLRGMFKARTVRATLGTPVTAVVKKSVELKVPVPVRK